MVTIKALTLSILYYIQCYDATIDLRFTIDDFGLAMNPESEIVNPKSLASERTTGYNKA